MVKRSFSFLSSLAVLLFYAQQANCVYILLKLSMLINADCDTIP